MMRSTRYGSRRCPTTCKQVDAQQSQAGSDKRHACLGGRFQAAVLRVPWRLPQLRAPHLAHRLSKLLLCICLLAAAGGAALNAADAGHGAFRLGA